MSAALLLPVIAYLCGALPWGLWLGRGFKGVDVRTVGSGNLGATNVYRALGPGLGVATLVLDVAKGALPVWLLPGLPIASGFPGGTEWCAVVTGLAAIVGHVWTVFAGFKGGKGVATTAGVLLALSPPAFLAFALAFVATVALTRYISLGSMLGAVAFAATLMLRSTSGLRSPVVVFGLLAAAVVILRHRENIARLMSGSERRFQFKGHAS